MYVFGISFINIVIIYHFCLFIQLTRYALVLNGTDTIQGGLLQAHMISNERGMIMLDGRSPQDKPC